MYSTFTGTDAERLYMVAIQNDWKEHYQLSVKESLTGYI